MSHMTRKKKKKRDKNSLLRGLNGFNTGTRDMGYKSNQDRKEQAIIQSTRKEEQ